MIYMLANILKLYCVDYKLYPNVLVVSGDRRSSVNFALTSIGFTEFSEDTMKWKIATAIVTKGDIKLVVQKQYNSLIIRNGTNWGLDLLSAVLNIQLLQNAPNIKWLSLGPNELQFFLQFQLYATMWFNID